MNNSVKFYSLIRSGYDNCCYVVGTGSKTSSTRCTQLTGGRRAIPVVGGGDTVVIMLIEVYRCDYHCNDLNHKNDKTNNYHKIIIFIMMDLLCS